MKHDFLEYLRYGAEAIGLGVLFVVFWILPASIASNLGGWIGRSIGPHLAASRKARRNLKRALPELNATACDETITGMWEHLGRVVAEYPHLETLALDRTQILGVENLETALNNPKGAIFFGAHLGNWEVNGAAVLLQCGREVALSYRAPNNPWSDKLLMWARTLGGRLSAYPKSRQGGKHMMDRIKDGGALGILIDQKYNQGVDVPFFGLAAMTNPFFVQLAQKYGCALVPIRNRRLDGASFSLTVYKPLAVFDEDGAPRPVEEVIAEAHALLEEFIRETPEQWLWLHRRWKD
ncbi:MAG: lysophospholipid acyltransferase family protein [Rhodospirillales bacterium]|nr:lysophospholipid acyltransferase family protein [Rhodospirillales bacterium]